MELAVSRAQRRHFVVTPNIQHIALLEDSPGLQRAYEEASLVLPDGAPVAIVAGSLAGLHQERITGADLLPRLCQRAAEERLPVGFVGGRPGAVTEAVRRLRVRFPELDVVLQEVPPPGFEDDPDALQRMLASVRSTSPRILFLALGTPKQEVLAQRHAAELGEGVALCVGAAVDFVAGMQTRAPVLVQRLGLEWLWRVLAEPRRLAPRYARAAPVFARVLGLRLPVALLRRPFLRR
jgi:N-acetylglucosaminyldiphosphoundecaprenol N-acetyl-beta-D-mannosaminyltransferase